MKIEINNSFNRDAKKLSNAILDELKAIYQPWKKFNHQMNLLIQLRKWKEAEK